MNASRPRPTSGVRAPAMDLLLVVRPLPMDRSVTVRALDSRGEPVSGATVFTHALNFRTPSDPPVTDENGRATLEDLPPVRILVFVDPPGEKIDSEKGTRVRVVPDGQEVTAELKVP